jgi:hydroxymethylglutaryl-CoA lyase
VDAVEIVEVAARDGLQNEPTVLPTADKLDLIRRSLAAGVRRIEVASFVDPAKVPQLADAEDVVAGLPPADGAVYVGLVLNRRGLERALAGGLPEVNYVLFATDEFSRRNQGMGTGRSLEVWADVAVAGRAAGVRATLTISAAFGCPYTGEVPTARVAGLVGQAAAAGLDEVALGDTIGVGVPTQVTELVAAVREAAPGVRLRCHFHDTRNTGLANAYAAVLAGVDALDASTGGIGGCPFAPAATGNVPTEDLVWMLERMGVSTGLDVGILIETAAWLGERLDRSLPARLGRAGIFPVRSVRPA